MPKLFHMVFAIVAVCCSQLPGAEPEGNQNIAEIHDLILRTRILQKSEKFDSVAVMTMGKQLMMRKRLNLRPGLFTIICCNAVSLQMMR